MWLNPCTGRKTMYWGGKASKPYLWLHPTAQTKIETSKLDIFLTFNPDFE
jgi:hypothetical protein